MSAWKVTLTLFARHNGKHWKHQATAWARTAREAMQQVRSEFEQSRTGTGSVVGIEATKV